RGYVVHCDYIFLRNKCCQAIKLEDDVIYPNPTFIIIDVGRGVPFGLFLACILGIRFCYSRKYLFLLSNFNVMPSPDNNKKQKLKQMMELNDELENYFKNSIIPQLFVHDYLLLRMCNPPAMKQFNFNPENIGKQFEDLVDNI